MVYEVVFNRWLLLVSVLGWSNWRFGFSRLPNVRGYVIAEVIAFSSSNYAKLYIDTSEISVNIGIRLCLLLIDIGTID